MTAPLKCAHVHRAINQIVGKFADAGIERRGRNLADGYDYRRVDDLLDRLAPLLAAHRLNVLPRVLRRQEFDRQMDGKSLCCVNLHVAFELISARDGSSITVEAYGEAWDESDKATAKASTAAFKTAMFQLFCIPVAGAEADQSSPRFKCTLAYLEPPQGWQIWSQELRTSLEQCATKSALDTTRERAADLLAGLKRERVELYRLVGDTYLKQLNEVSAQLADAGSAASGIRDA